MWSWKMQSTLYSLVLYFDAACSHHRRLSSRVVASSQGIVSCLLGGLPFPFVFLIFIHILFPFLALSFPLESEGSD